MSALNLNKKEVHIKIHKEILSKLEENIYKIFQYFILNKEVLMEHKKELLNVWERVSIHRLLEESENGPYHRVLKDQRFEGLQGLKRYHELLESFIVEMKTIQDDFKFVIKNLAALELFKKHIELEESILFS
ncbi:MAG: hypothetical protein QXV69_05445 [Sulfolobaceae archaeon]